MMSTNQVVIAGGLRFVNVPPNIANIIREIRFLSKNFVFWDMMFPKDEQVKVRVEVFILSWLRDKFSTNPIKVRCYDRAYKNVIIALLSYIEFERPIHAALISRIHELYWF